MRQRLLVLFVLISCALGFLTIAALQPSCPTTQSYDGNCYEPR